MIGYLLVAGLVTAARLAFPVRPAALTPGYWVFMGASAISVLAGAQILRLPPSPLTTATHAVVAGSSVVLWAFGTWLVPLLLILGVWRHVRHQVPLAYEPGMWSMVFPIGMYGVASRELGAALRVPWLVTLGRDEAWLALAAWAAVSLAMTLAALSRRAPVSNYLYRVTILDIMAAARCLPDPGRVVAAVKRYKFQALVTLNGNKEPDARPGPDPRRMVLRGRNDESRHNKLFSALVSCDDDGPFRPGGRQQLITVRLAGDDVADYFGVGGHFDVWMGDDIGQGVITRRLFV